MVERILPSASLEALEAMRHAAEDACRGFAATGTPIRYVRSTLTPGDSRCRCLFEAPSADLVREVNDSAQFPCSRIMLAIESPRSPSTTTQQNDPHAKERVL
jgi:hypothetical protein